jgi:urease accessory protein
MLVDESWLLDPAHGALGQRLGRFDALANVFLAGPLFAPAREALGIAGQPVAPRARLLASVSPVAADAVLVRFAATSVEELIRDLRARLFAIPALLGDDPWARRA